MGGALTVLRLLTDSVTLLDQVGLLDIPKFAFQAVNLSDFLAQGFPLELIQFYGALLAAHWFISLYRFQRRTIDRKCVLTRMSLLYVPTRSRASHTVFGVIASSAPLILSRFTNQVH